jgi:hypothetical protein
MCEMCDKIKAKAIAEPDSLGGRLKQASDLFLQYVGEHTSPKDFIGKPTVELPVRIPKNALKYLRRLAKEFELPFEKMAYSFIQAAVILGLDEMLDRFAESNKLGVYSTAANSDFSASDKDLSVSLGDEIADGLKKLMNKTVH